MSESQFGYILAPEMLARLRWFASLRWCASGGLALAAAVGPRFGLPTVWPELLIVALAVAAYNLAFVGVLRARRERGHPYANLQASALLQIVMDLAALLVVVHLTGGLHSPLLVFFAFHMAIGTMMLRRRTMYLVATATSLGVLALWMGEVLGRLPRRLLVTPDLISLRVEVVAMLALAVALFGMVYLTGTITTRFKERNIELHDATEALRERTAELQRLLAEKEEIERRKSHYMRISAHQLRSPLGTVKTSLQVLLDGILEPSSEGGRKLLAGAADRVDDLLEIVNDLLELAKMREGRAKAPWTRQVFVNQLLADIFDALEPFARQRGVSLVADIQGIAKLDWGVPPDLVYAFENLVHNGIKYSNEGGVVTVRMRVAEGVARVTVEDRGIGIPPDLVDDVFLEFVRAPNAKRVVNEGTGLGLSIVREAVAMHGGTVRAQSTLEQGSAFTVELPLAYAPPELAGRDLDRRHAGPEG